MARYIRTRGADRTLTEEISVQPALTLSGPSLSLASSRARELYGLCQRQLSASTSRPLSPAGCRPLGSLATSGDVHRDRLLRFSRSREAALVITRRIRSIVGSTCPSLCAEGQGGVIAGVDVDSGAPQPSQKGRGHWNKGAPTSVPSGKDPPQIRRATIRS
jgi:hypothetical protein